MIRSKIFKAHDVRAFLEGRKTVFREPLKPQPSQTHEIPERASYIMNPRMDSDKDGVWAIFDYTMGETECHLCPYLPGSKIFVKETYRLLDCECDTCRHAGHVWYEADLSGYENASFCTKRSAAQMPRWASRITLEIVSARVERIQDVTEEEARKEGCCGVESTHFGTPNFRWYWQSLHGAESWQRNDWVWRVEVITK